MFKFITRRPFVVNLIVAIALTCAIFSIFFMSLAAMTRHGDNKKVPDVLGKNIDEAVQILKNAGLDVEVQDSIYVDSLPKLSVLKQTPDADAVVKENRTIYLTINTAVAPMIEMPDLRGFSITSAQMLLQSLGLKLAGTEFIPDVAKNAVKQQKMNGTDIAPGTKIPAGSGIVLVLGNGMGSETMDVPNILGMTVAEARDYLQTMKASLGAVNPDPDVEDPEEAYIYKQNPGFRDGGTKAKMSLGQSISVWVSKEPKGAAANAATKAQQEDSVNAE